jgi:hypothetical protein
VPQRLASNPQPSDDIRLSASVRLPFGRPDGSAVIAARPDQRPLGSSDRPLGAALPAMTLSTYANPSAEWKTSPAKGSLLSLPAGPPTWLERITVSRENDMNPNQQEHAYEELREVVINVLLDADENGVDRFEKLLEKTALELCRNDGLEQAEQHYSYGSAARLHPNDAELVLEIVWDLFRQGILTMGSNMSNPGWPWFRLSRFGEYALQHGHYRFHNKAGFMKALRSGAADLSPDAALYLKEAITAFYTDCLLSTCVMLGIAAESEFLRLLDVAKDSKTFGKHFSRIGDGLSIRAKIWRFAESIKPILSSLPKSATDGLSDTLNTIQSFIRTTRNEAGQPSGANPPSREQVYVYLQLFIPCAEHLMRLRRELTEPDYPRLVPAP